MAQGRAEEDCKGHAGAGRERNKTFPHFPFDCPATKGVRDSTRLFLQDTFTPTRIGGISSDNGIGLEASDIRFLPRVSFLQLHVLLAVRWVWRHQELCGVMLWCYDARGRLGSERGIIRELS